VSWTPAASARSARRLIMAEMISLAHLSGER
jgi:hypothetical protein